MNNIEEKGIRKGIEQGEFNIIALYNWLKESGRDTDAEEMMKLENEDLRVGLYVEYNTSKNRWDNNTGSFVKNNKLST